MKIALLLTAAPLTSIVALVACGGPIEGGGAPSDRQEQPASAEARVSLVDQPSRFDGASPSLEMLSRSVLTALADGDERTLERFRLTEHEHNEVVWPELPASGPEIGFPVDYAWTNIQNRNRRAVSRLLDLYAGRALAFDSVECRGESQPFETFGVLTDCYVVFTLDGPDSTWEAQIFKDVLMGDGGFKIFRYYDGRPRPSSGGRGDGARSPRT